MEISLEESGVQNNPEAYVNNFNNNGHLPSGFSMINEDGHLVHTCSTRSGSKHLDVQDLEMLLEAYFVQVDSTLNKLSTVCCYQAHPILSLCISYEL